MQPKASKGSPSQDFDNETKDLKILMKLVEDRQAPGEEISGETWEEIRRIRKNKSKS
jgi:hypothetical protein